MKCPNCGYEIEKPNLKICPLCGSSLKSDGKDEHPTQNDTPINEQRDIDIPEEIIFDTKVVDAQEKSQKRCQRCQSPLPSAGNFCPICGLNIRENEEEKPQIEKSTTIIESQVETMPNSNIPEPISQFQQEDVYENELQPQNQNMELQNSDYQEPLYNDEENEEQGYENGGYYPYSNQEESYASDGDESAIDRGKFNSPLLTIVLSIIVSLFLGIFLFFITQ